MIIWLNGTFGVGKTSTAERLATLIPGSRVFDPETVGYLLQANLGDRPVSDFQDWSAWRPLVAATLTEVARMTGQHLIAPQTVLKREYLEQIFAGLQAAELDVFHVVLDAADAVLRSRIKGSDAAQIWRLEHLDEYTAARPWMIEAADFVVDTAASTPPQIARRIIAALPKLSDLTGHQDVVATARAAAKPQSAAKPDAAAKPEVTEKPKAAARPRMTEKPGLADHR